jgi:hypothetical protein
MRAGIAVLLIVLAMPAGAQNWLRYGDAADSTATFYYDPSTVRVNGSMRRVWQLQDLKEPGWSLQEPKSRAVQSRKALSEFDCKGERHRTLAFSEFSGPLGMGSLVASDTFDPPPGVGWQFVAPASMGNTLFKLVCAAKK